MPDHIPTEQLADRAAFAARDGDFVFARYWAVELVRRALQAGGNCRAGYLAALQEAAELLEGVGLAVAEAEARTPDAEARSPAPPA